MQDFTYQIMAMQSLAHQQLLRGLTHTELSTGQPKVLAYLKSHEGQRQKTIAQACQLEPSSLTVLLNRMEKQGMISRRHQSDDRRSLSVYLTDYGRSLATQVVERFYEVERAALSGISPEDESVFERVCKQILENLKLED